MKGRCKREEQPHPGSQEADKGERQQPGWVDSSDSVQVQGYLHTPGPTSYFSLPPNNAIL